MNAEIRTKLEEMAMEETTPFCYTCYTDCPCGRCDDCGSDDLMRHLPGVGVEYGTEWVFEHLVKSLKTVDTEEIFEDMMEGAYGETTMVGPCEVNVVDVLKEDSIWWHEAKWEYLDGLVADDELTEIEGEYYWTSDLEDHL